MNPDKKLTLAFSPCPNDTFMFHAMIHNLVDTKGLEFECHIEDVETLNKHAFNDKFDITKISFHALGYLTKKYSMLSSGAALGRACGPLLISKYPELKKDPKDLIIAVPGTYTTANLLLSLYWQNAKNKVNMLFSDIEKAVLNEDVDIGLIIHENRFTYEMNGLHKICDLGEWWENTTKLPIPLGCIAVKTVFEESLKNQIENVLRDSINFAFNNPEASMDYVMSNATDVEKSIVKKHINLYVNDFSLNIGNEGKKAVNLLFEKGKESGIFK